VTRAFITDFIETTVSDEDIQVIIPDGLDAAFVGLMRTDDAYIAVYSIEKSIQIIAKEMPETDAVEHFWYNVDGAKGKGYPVFIHTPNTDESSWSVSLPFTFD